MTIRSQGDLEGMRHVGRLVAECFPVLEALVRPGVTTAAIDAEAERFFTARGATSGPQRDYDFPGFICISVNDEIVHGIPGAREIAPGDLVKLDVTAECGGYIADAAISVPVPPVEDATRRLVACAREAFEAAMRVTRAGLPIVGIGRAVEGVTTRYGFQVVRELSGHGVGRRVHEPPEVPNWDDPSIHGTLHAGQVIAVEPILSVGPGRALEASDGWTMLQENACLAVHHEHTLVVRDGPPLILTLPH
ncbi:MAG TPA: type I methionyl aminopeptidase [Candidatus Polarisedimenticolia bacterium]|jgi:methionyl aminopeptidase|nr:type I methionyl aminopeptidase [Candidatus Polarisedimenticolia bacterium]